MRHYTKATTSILEALMHYHQAKKHYNLNVSIVVVKNLNHDSPIQIPNPALDNPFNWTSSCSSPGSFTKDEIDKAHNKTHRELMLEWTDCFGTREAVRLYQEENIITPELSSGRGFSTLIKQSDLISIRPDLKGYKFWKHLFVPKKGIPYWVPDPSIDYVYAVVILDDGEKIDEKEVFRNLLDKCIE